MSARRNPQGRLEFLTVEEAAQVLRVGRTKAYAMAREWRDTKGASGLPVVDLGSVLRVPRVAIENLAGAPILGPVRPGSDHAAAEPIPERSASTRAGDRQRVASASAPPRRAARHTRLAEAPSDQLALFDLPSTARK